MSMRIVVIQGNFFSVGLTTGMCADVRVSKFEVGSQLSTNVVYPKASPREVGRTLAAEDI